MLARTIVWRPIDSMRHETLTPGPHFCRWLWHCVTVLCDGRVTCGLDDPQGKAVYGDAKTMSIREIMSCETARRRRDDLLAGRLCSSPPCTLYSPLPSPPPLPSAVPCEAVIEPTIRCNLRCANPTCEVNNDPHSGVRESDFLGLDTFRKVMDEIGPDLRVLHFYNYGESFMHPRAVDMLAYSRQINPSLLIAGATNGILMSDSVLAGAVTDLANQVYVSISGVTPESYYQYQRRKLLAQALRGLENLVNEKARRNAKHLTIVWRYLVFRWNDTDEEIELAKSIARSIGVDRLLFTPTAYPVSSRSLRRMPGTPGFLQIKDMAELACGYENQCLVDEGLYGKEVSESFGAFWWTGKKARIEVFTDSRRVNLRLMDLRPAGVEVPTVRISTPWERRLGWVGNTSWADNDLQVPPEAVNTLVPIDLDVSCTWVPAGAGAGPDTRELGVAVSIGPDS